MSISRVQVSLQHFDRAARDRFVNTWTVSTIDASGALSFSAVTTAFTDFYKGISQWFPASLSGPASTIKYYPSANWGSHEPPEHTDTFQDSDFPSQQHALPYEVAMVMTLRGAHQPLPIKRQSYTGRVFLGPLSVNTVDDGAPSTSFINSVFAAGQALVADLFTAGVQLGVASLKHRQFYPLASISIDNAFDTQRSRGLAPTTVLRTPPFAVGIQNPVSF